MANNSKMSKSASIEDLQERNTQLEAEVGRLASEMQEVLKRQEESSRRQEESSRKQDESQRKMEEASRALDDKVSNLGLMLERTLRQISGMVPNLYCGETSRNNGKGIDEARMDQNCDLNSQEIHCFESSIKNKERVTRSDHRKGTQLPRMDFPRFDGSDPTMWQLNCEFYFELYEVPEVFKSRMAVMNFSKELPEWHRCLTNGRHQMPWDLLVEEIMARFKNHSIKKPVDEFKRVYQVGRVEEFIKKFERVKARLLWKKPGLDEEFFVDGFINGLKEEIRHTVELFNPRRLNNTFQCALKVEATQESNNRRPKEVNKGYKFLKNQKGDNDRRVNRETSTQKPWQ